MDAKELAKEEAVLERRHWVRLTKACNNRCLFCLDTDAQDGSTLPLEAIKAEIRRGLTIGGERLILSGGEPTIHPQFAELVAFGRSLGYKGVQTISNGRMFSYKRFCNSVLDAGLSEVTVSIHGHTPELHDMLVGVPGAFDQAVRGLKNLLADGRCVVNIDIVINKQNATHIDEIMRYFINMGIHEFDLLQISPYGRTYPENKDLLIYDVREALPALRRAFDMASRPDLFVWSNRFPAHYLEGYERLIQDPKKIYDEVNGRRTELFDPYVSDRGGLICLGDRCRYCFIRDFCVSLMSTKALIEAGTYDAVRISGEDRLELYRKYGAGRKAWLKTAGAAEAGAVLAGIDTKNTRIILDLDSYHLAQGLLRTYASIERVIVHEGEDLDRVVAAAGADVIIEVSLNRSTIDWLYEHDEYVEANQDRFVFSMKNHELLSSAIGREVPVAELLTETMFSRVSVSNIPRCMAPGRRRDEPPRTLDLSVFGADGDIGMFRFTRWYIINEYYTKSLRCAECAHTRHCRGAHINTVRNLGFAMLQPVQAGSDAFYEKALSIEMLQNGAADADNDFERVFWDSVGLARPARRRTRQPGSDSGLDELKGYFDRFSEPIRSAVAACEKYPGDVDLLPGTALLKLGRRKALRVEFPAAYEERVQEAFHDYLVTDGRKKRTEETRPDEMLDLFVFTSNEDMNEFEKILSDETDAYASGHVSGYPACCVRFFTTPSEMRPGPKPVYEATLNTPGRGDMTLNTVLPLPRARLIPHYPCAHDCAASISAARAVLNYYRGKYRPLADALEQALPTVMLYFDDRRMIVFDGEMEAGRLTYGGFSPLLLSESDAEKSAAALFHQEIVSRIAEGDGMELTGASILIYSGRRKIHTFERKHLYAGALLDFTGRG